MWVPPARGEGVEVGDFGGIDRRGSGTRALRSKLVLDIARSGAEEEIEVP